MSFPGTNFKCAPYPQKPSIKNRSLSECFSSQIPSNSRSKNQMHFRFQLRENLERSCSLLRSQSTPTRQRLIWSMGITSMPDKRHPPTKWDHWAEQCFHLETFPSSEATFVRSKSFQVELTPSFKGLLQIFSKKLITFPL